MEKINKHNYEAYFLDYLEGTLSAEEKHDMFVFLDQNPELKKDLDLDLGEVSLDPSAAVFENKGALKVEDESILALNTAEVWMIESVEKNLTASKQIELDDFIRKHQLEKTYAAYQSTLLKPDLNLVFEDKQKLKVATGIVIPLYLRVSAIAAIGIILIGVALNRFGGNQIDAPQDKTQLFAADYNAGIPADVLAKMTVNQNDVVIQPDDLIVKENNMSVDKNKVVVPNDFVDNRPNEKKDSTLKSDGIQPDDIVKDDKPKDEFIPLPDNDNDVVITPFNSEFKPTVITEEPYKLVTDVASNITNREVEFTRDKEVGTNEYVAYGFKIGNFEFERKKSE